MNSIEESSYPLKIQNILNKNISLLTNLVAFLVLLLGFLPTQFSNELKTIGIFALSGSLTNWLAIHMLFEKIPGLYGSGIIPKKFQTLKLSIHSLMMKQFFATDIIKKFYKTSDNKTLEKAMLGFIQSLDYDDLFTKLLKSIETSSLGGMLQMLGGTTVLEPLKPTFTEKIQTTLQETVQDPSFKERLEKHLEQAIDFEQLATTINNTVSQRLEELTPNMIKEMIQNMIKDHLGWLVVWGGVFGGIIGFISTILM